MGDDIIINRKLIALILVAAVASCMLAGCLGDKVVGTWKSTSTSTLITFNKDNTFSIDLVLLGDINGTWKKADGAYTLYSNSGDVLGKALFLSNGNLQVTLAGGLLSSEFTKIS
jgi:hypothetical protein